MEEGLYESIVTEELGDRLAGLSLSPALRRVDEADLPHVLSRHIAVTVEQVLSATRGVDERLSIVNAVLDLLDRAPLAVRTPTSIRSCSSVPPKARRSSCSSSAAACAARARR